MTESELYVGYQPRASKHTARLMVGVGLVMIGGAVVLGVLIGGAQDALPAASFEFGDARDFEGTLTGEPVPMLLVDRPGHPRSGSPVSPYYLTVFGKRGAESLVRGIEGRRVTLSGSLIHRDDQTMIEVVEGSVSERATGTEAGGAGATGADDTAKVFTRSYGQTTVRGQIVDSKCFLGVMNPGSGKPHRACAARCISGGVPPMLVVRDRSGPAVYVLLVGADGRAVNREILDKVAETVEVTGNLIRTGDVWVLYASPASYRRVS